MNYNYDLAYAALRLLPPVFRKPRILALLSAMLYPAQVVRDHYFNFYKPDVEQRTRYNSQKIVFEALLNRYFLINSGDRIYIETVSALVQPIWFYNSHEGYDAVFFDPSIFFPTASDVYPPLDFIVYAPLFLQSQQAQLKAQIELHRLAGTRYQIQYY